MTRTWISDTDHRWVMLCDQQGCATRSDPFPKEPRLEIFRAQGWFVARRFGDICPACLAAGVTPTGDGWLGTQLVTAQETGGAR